MKQTTKKRLPTRRRRALTRLALIAGIVVYMVVFRLYNFLPAQALYYAEEKEHTGRTEVIVRETGLDLETTDASRMYLSVRENTGLLTGMHFNPLTGWDTGPVCSWDFPAEEPVSGYAWTPYMRGNTSSAYGFVRISDPDITEVAVRFQGLREWDGAQNEWARDDVLRVRSEASEWTEYEGHRYLLVAQNVEWPEDLEWGPCYMVVTAFDAGGHVIAEFDSYWADFIG